MSPFTAEALVLLYGSAINNVLFTAVGRMSHVYNGIRCRFSNCQTKVYRLFLAILRYVKRKPAIEGTTKPRGGYRYTVYCLGIPLYGKKYDAVFYFVLNF